MDEKDTKSTTANPKSKTITGSHSLYQRMERILFPSCTNAAQFQKMKTTREKKMPNFLTGYPKAPRPFFTETSADAQ